MYSVVGKWAHPQESLRLNRQLLLFLALSAVDNDY